MLRPTFDGLRRQQEGRRFRDGRSERSAADVCASDAEEYCDCEGWHRPQGAAPFLAHRTTRRTTKSLSSGILAHCWHNASSFATGWSMIDFK